MDIIIIMVRVADCLDIENLILATHEELASVRERERLLAASLPEDILEVTTQIFPPNIYFVNFPYL